MTTAPIRLPAAVVEVFQGLFPGFLDQQMESVPTVTTYPVEVELTMLVCVQRHASQSMDALVLFSLGCLVLGLAT